MRSKKALYNIVTNLLLQVFILAYGFIIPKLIINSYSSEVYGLIASISQFLSYITLLESGVGSVVKAQLYEPLSKYNKNEIVNILRSSERFFRHISFVFIIYILIMCFAYPLVVSNSFSFLFTVSLILIISISTFAEYYFGMTYKLLIQADQKTYVISITQIITYIISILSIVIMVKLDFSIHELKLYSSIIFLMRPLILCYYVHRKYKLDFDCYDKNYKLNNKWDGLAQHIAFVIHNNTDVTLLTIFSSLINVSIYSVYSIVTKGIRSIIQAFSIGIDASWGNMLARKEYEAVNKKFSIYETIYLMIATFVYSCTIVLITQFVKVYTIDVKDANYVSPIFGFLIVLSEFIWAIRLPYSSITLAAGHFKQTRRGAWIECLLNIVVSLIFVIKYGLIGVAIGTIVAMSFRTIEFIYHTNKYILNRSFWNNVKKILLTIIQTAIIICLSIFLPFFDNISYINWILNAIMVALVSGFVSLIFNWLFYRNELFEILLMIKRVFIKRS